MVIPGTTENSLRDIQSLDTLKENEECQQSLDTLKEKMVTAPILVFPDWTKPFHVHVDASGITLGIVLTQLGEGGIDHPIAYSSRKELHHNRKRRLSYGVRATEVQALPIGCPVQDVY